MKKGLNRRTFLLAATAAGGVRFVPPVVARLGGKRVLTLVVDRATGTLRAVDRLLP
jgi:hypothetical protein